MPFRRLLLPVLTCALAAQQAPSLSGHWEGPLQLPNGSAMKLTLDLKQDAAGLKGELGSPDQGAKTMAIANADMKEGQLSFAVPGVPGDAHALLKPSVDGQRLEGTFFQAGLSLPLTLSRGKVEVSNPIKDAYTKVEYDIPMRDGVKLHTVVYLPKDTSADHPILMQRTPYSAAPYGADKFKRGLGPSKLFLDQGYIVAYQDSRGRWMSEGKFVDMRPEDHETTGGIDESTDTYDTIDWMVKHLPHNNGKVGIWGISYPGYYAACSLIGSHPALKAVSPQAPMNDLWIGDDSFHNGAFQLAANYSFSTFFKTIHPKPTAEAPGSIDVGTEDGYAFYKSLPPLAEEAERRFKDWDPTFAEYLKHSTYDSYWQARNLSQHLKGVKPAVLVVGGWFDAEDLYGALHTYGSIEKQNPGIQNNLVMGPWAHGFWASPDGSSLGLARFGDKTSLWYQKEIELPFFNHYLKDGADPKLAEATIFETGSNQWKRFDTWPPQAAKPVSFYFQPGGGLSMAKPDAKGGGDSFVSDPNKPVPHTEKIGLDYDRTYMTADQRSASTRPDVMVYETEPLKADVTLAGPLRPDLWVSTTGTDSDWVVKLIDVFPEDAKDPEGTPEGFHYGGYQMLVRGDTLRGKFRNSLQNPEPFTPGKATEVAFTLNDVCHTFQKGHRIMIQVQCSWFPVVDRNPQTFCDIPNAKPSDYQKATQTIFHAANMPSRIEALELP
ncbi:MAG TPA: CocE/NonD family hydrolase [Holophagaceae bacterium]|nr:CocE/NonD family hydrolase [Holophagaceae bacterium]